MSLAKRYINSPTVWRKTMMNSVCIHINGVLRCRSQPCHSWTILRWIPFGNISSNICLHSLLDYVFIHVKCFQSNLLIMFFVESIAPVYNGTNQARLAISFTLLSTVSFSMMNVICSSVAVTSKQETITVWEQIASPTLNWCYADRTINSCLFACRIKQFGHKLCQSIEFAPFRIVVAGALFFFFTKN